MTRARRPTPSTAMPRLGCPPTRKCWKAATRRPRAPPIAVGSTSFCRSLWPMTSRCRRGLSVPFLLPQHLHEDAKALVESLGIKFGHFVQPLRAVLTGTNKGPGLFDAIWLLGKETCLARLRAKR